jgi:amino acid transporter
MDYLNDNNFENGGMNQETKNNFSSLAQLINIASIMAFVSIGVSLIGLFIGFAKPQVFGSPIPYNTQVVISFITLALTLLLNFILFNAAKNIKLGTDNDDQGSFNIGVSKLATYYKIIGIIVIVFLSICVLAFLFGIVFGAASGLK